MLDWHARCGRGRWSLGPPPTASQEISVRLPMRLAVLALPFLAIGPGTTPASAQFQYPPYPGYRLAMPESDLRFEVKPKEASVYIDGYFAGKVDEFDGTFQRLHVTPGEH